jgi:hypothetical protein
MDAIERTNEMETQYNKLSILNADIAVVTLPTQKTLRIAKALGYAAVLHDCTEDTTGATLDNDVRHLVETACLRYDNVALAPAGTAPADSLAQIKGVVARLPKPLLVTSRDPHKAAAMMAAIVVTDLPQREDDAVADQPGGPARSTRTAA